MNASPLPRPEPAMKARQPMSRDQLMFTVVFILLAVLTILLWFQDPVHRYTGKSRIDWPPPVQPKP
jgi:hypothetical protein